MVLFNSDYLEGAHPRILKRLANTNMVQTPGYGEDEYCEQARATIRGLCEAPDADVHFLVGGTQTNATEVQLRIHHVPSKLNNARMEDFSSREGLT